MHEAGLLREANKRYATNGRPTECEEIKAVGFRAVSGNYVFGVFIVMWSGAGLSLGIFITEWIVHLKGHRMRK